MQSNDGLRSGVQITGPRVVAQPAPQRQDIVERRCRERLHAGKTRKEAPVVRNNGGNLGLLQHDLGEPDAVGIARPLPRQVVAPVTGLPAHQPAGQVAHRLIRPLRKSLPRCSSLSSAFPARSFTTSLSKALKSGWNCGASSGPSIFTGSVLPARSPRSLPPWPVEDATNETFAR